MLQVIRARISRLGWIALISLFALALAACNVTPLICPPSSAQAKSPAESLAGRTKGNASARIKFVEFSDFQWPYCKEFALGAERRIEEEYIKTGKVAFTYKYLPIVDGLDIDESHWAAYAAECANEQGKFWEYHDKLFSMWAGEAVGTYTKANLKKYAADLKLDTVKFNQCLDTDKYKFAVDADMAEAYRWGIPGTPTLLANDEPLEIYSLDFSEFSRAFDALLK